MTSSDADIIIAGAGAAGLHLAWYLKRAGLAGRRVLLIDRDRKEANDRTWCFWERGENPLEAHLYRRWTDLQFKSPRWSGRLALGGYVYKMMRGSDFYAAMRADFEGEPGIEWRLGDIASVADAANGGAEVRLADGAIVRAPLVFSSLRGPEPTPAPGRVSLLQHFVGWVIRVEHPVFDPGQATLMDFNVPQDGETRFVYVLPLDERTALVEFTVFSPAILPREVYARGLETYIRSNLGDPAYAIAHQEFGVIPMTDTPFAAASAGGGVINIGTAGGATKPSTGYTFKRIQAQTARIAANVGAGRAPLAGARTGSGRYGFFDRVLLNVLARGRRAGADVFTDMFSRVDASTVFDFLDETSTLAQDAQVLWNSTRGPFVAAALDVMADDARRRLGIGI